MQGEQPNTPSADVTSRDLEASATGSSESTEQESSASPSWWQRLFNRHPNEGQETEPGSQDQSTASQTSKARTVTEEELQRLVQSETDRRERKRREEDSAKQRRELRDNDPWAYAEQDRREEQTQLGNAQLEQFLAGIGTEHDRVSIDPVVELLPQPERERILKLEGAGRGLDGRKLVVTEALKALEKHWKAEGAKVAEARLRGNPAFRKQVLGEARDGSVEPELLPAGGPSSTADQTVSALLRTYYDLPAPANHNSAS